MMATAAGWTAAANTEKLNQAIEQYAIVFQKELGDVIRWVAVGLIKDVAQNNPVDTGRSRAAWLPFLWKAGAQVPLKASPAAQRRMGSAKVQLAQREGLQKQKYSFLFKGWKPFALVSNNVEYVVYLEYGVRKGAAKKIPIEDAPLSPVAKSGTAGFVRAAIKRWQRELMQKVKGS